MVGKRQRVSRAGLVDELYSIKQELKPLEKRKEEIEKILKEDLSGNGIDSLEGKIARATLGTREDKVVDGEAFWDLIDGDIDKLLSVVNFRLDPKDEKLGIKSYIGEEDLKAISSIKEVLVLRITPLSDEKPVPLSTKIVVGDPPSMVAGNSGRRIPGRRATKA